MGTGACNCDMSCSWLRRGGIWLPREGDSYDCRIANPRGLPSAPCNHEGRLDPSEKLPGYVDAADILRERGHTDIEIARLAGEFGRDLLLVARQDKPVRTYVDAEFGAHGHVDKEIALYHRVDDARMIEDVLASFRQRQLFKRVMAGLPDPKAKRKHTRNAEEPQAKESPASKRRRLFLEAHGRGRRVQPMQNRMDT